MNYQIVMFASCVSIIFLIINIIYLIYMGTLNLLWINQRSIWLTINAIMNIAAIVVLYICSLVTYIYSDIKKYDSGLFGSHFIAMLIFSFLEFILTIIGTTILAMSYTEMTNLTNMSIAVLVIQWVLVVCYWGTCIICCIAVTIRR